VPGVINCQRNHIKTVGPPDLAATPQQIIKARNSDGSRNMADWRTKLTLSNRLQRLIPTAGFRMGYRRFVDAILGRLRDIFAFRVLADSVRQAADQNPRPEQTGFPRHDRRGLLWQQPAGARPPDRRELSIANSIGDLLERRTRNAVIRGPDAAHRPGADVFEPQRTSDTGVYNGPGLAYKHGRRPMARLELPYQSFVTLSGRRAQGWSA